MLNHNKIFHGDFLANELPDGCAKLIIADPPYYRVKGKFDFVWSTFDAYLEDVTKWAAECSRLLANNGTLFWWGHAKKIAYSQIILDRFFNLENSIAVEFNRQTKKGVEQFRCFAPVSERLLMYSREIGQTGLQYIDENFVKPLNPFREVIKAARLKAGKTTIQVAEEGKFYGKVNHGGSVANWENGDNIPTPEQWVKLCSILNVEASYDSVKNAYGDLRQLYETLRLEYENKRRPFNNFLKLCDVMKFDQESHTTRHYKHDTVKPERLTRALLLTCSQPGDLVIVPFAGSGTEVAMAIKEDRKAIGYEIDETYAAVANKRVSVIKQQRTLFATP